MLAWGTVYNVSLSHAPRPPYKSHQLSLTKPLSGQIPPPPPTHSNSTSAVLCRVHTRWRGGGVGTFKWCFFRTGAAVKMLSYHSVQAHDVSQLAQLSHVLFHCRLWSWLNFESPFTRLEMNMTHYQSRWQLSLCIQPLTTCLDVAELGTQTDCNRQLYVNIFQCIQYILA